MTRPSSELAHLFRALKAPAAARALPKLADRARQEEWSFEQFAAALLKTEADSRDSHGGQGRIKAARFPARKTLEEFDFSFQTSLRRETVLHLGQLDFLVGRENLVLLGPPGTGKSHLAIALGIRACLAGQRVAFRTATEWVAMLADAQRHGRLDDELARLQRIPLLIVDEVGYIPFDPQAANLMFMLVSRRYERASLIVTSNKTFSAWGDGGAASRGGPVVARFRWDHHCQMAMKTADDLLRRGREALVDADWERARSCFEQARALDESAEVLDGLGEAAHFLGEYQEAIEFKERAFAAYRRRDKRVEAAEVARWLAFLYGAVYGNRAAAGGWMAWAERLLEGVEESVEHGRLALDRAPWTDDPADRERHAAAALTIARRFGDRDLEFAAQAVLGHAYVVSGRVVDGMSLIDEAMAAVAGGEVADIDAIGSIYCRLLGACERATDVRRAEEWIAAARRFVAWGDFVTPTCRLHYGGILIAVGRWAEAEKELLAAARVFEGGYRGMRAAPLIRLAGLRVRQGRFEEAERLLEGNESRPPARQLLAEIALARGELALAKDRARLCLAGEDIASPACAPLLELLVQIHVAHGELDAAREPLERLTALATAGADERTSAAAEFAAGRLYAAAGDEQARSHLQAALDAFSSLDLPLEAGRAQLELARALAREAPAGAVAEARLALTTFERLGASRDADAAAELLRTLGETAGRAWPKRYGTLTKRETEVLSLVAAGCSNPEIAERLYISRRTAEHHVANILSKLELRSRAEAAAYAIRERSQIPVGE